VTSLSPGKGEKMSKHSVAAGHTAELLALFAELRRKAEVRTAKAILITIQEAGLDGFWLHVFCNRTALRATCRSGLDRDAAAAPAGQDGPLDGRRCCGRFSPTSAASRGSARWWLPPSPKRRTGGGLPRRATLIAERITHVNRIKGLLFSQGSAIRAAARDRRSRLETLRTGRRAELRRI